MLDKPTLLGFDINVKNHAENKNGKALGPLTEICAKVVNETAGKLEVSPCFLPSFLAGPYWIEAFDQEAGWALVSGGPPKNQVPMVVRLAQAPTIAACGYSHASRNGMTHLCKRSKALPK